MANFQTHFSSCQFLKEADRGQTQQVSKGVAINKMVSSPNLYPLSKTPWILGYHISEIFIKWYSSPMSDGYVKK